MSITSHCRQIKRHTPKAIFSAFCSKLSVKFLSFERQVYALLQLHNAFALKISAQHLLFLLLLLDTFNQHV